MARTFTVEAGVDLEDVLNEIEDSELATELEKRRLAPPSRNVVVSAVTAIRQGRHDEAILALERYFLPRWADKAECEMAYRSAMAAKP